MVVMAAMAAAVCRMPRCHSGAQGCRVRTGCFRCVLERKLGREGGRAVMVDFMVKVRGTKMKLWAGVISSTIRL
jgi:hypothetical protein